MTLLTTMLVTGSNLYQARYGKPAQRAGFFNLTDMSKYILSEIFTLLPADICTPETAAKTLIGQFSLDEETEVSSFILEKEGAAVVYPSVGSEADKSSLPFVIRLIEEASALDEHNKVVFHYCTGRKLSHTIIYIGEQLKLANSFKADSFESALYFLFLAIKGLQMNPRQCTVRVCCAITKEQENVFSRFFKGFQVNNLDILLQK